MVVSCLRNLLYAWSKSNGNCCMGVPDFLHVWSKSNRNRCMGGLGGLLQASNLSKSSNFNEFVLFIQVVELVDNFTHSLSENSLSSSYRMVSSGFPSSVITRTETCLVGAQSVNFVQSLASLIQSWYLFGLLRFGGVLLFAVAIS